MYVARPGLIVGFHGCDKRLRDSIVIGKSTLKASNNQYDWLGHGMYFWENNQQRALNFAKELKKNPRTGKKHINIPSVLGAVIDMGNCLDLLDTEYLALVKKSFHSLTESYKTLGVELPVNNYPKGSNELLLRNLDCRVIENLQQLWETGYPPFDSVRGVFVEGASLYPNAGFNEKNHIQICIRNPNCIKGSFIPRIADKNYFIP